MIEWITKHNPYLFTLSLTNGCNLNCPFCGARLIKEKSFLTKEMAELLAKDIASWNSKCRIDFSSFGEPFLNNDIFDILEIFRTYLKKSFICTYTNCTVINEEKIIKYFESGGNLLALDAYSEVMYSKMSKLMENLKGFLEDVKFINYISKYNNFPLYHYHSPKNRYLILMDVFNDQENIRERHNMADSVDTKLAKSLGFFVDDEPKPNKYCTRPFREMSVKVDGTVPICCVDWKNALVMGKFPEQSLKDIWFGEKFMKIRYELRYGRKTYPCSKCSYHGGYRIGLEKIIEVQE
jgi:MoaA/NifB/PqqE/SkfB family radical SAM enzyme